MLGVGPPAQATAQAQPSRNPRSYFSRRHGKDRARTTTPSPTLALLALIANEGFFRAGRWQEALVEFDAAWALTKHPDLLFNMAVCSERTDKTAAAIDDIERFLAASPTSEPDGSTMRRLQALRAKQQASAAPLIPKPSDKHTPLSRRQIAGIVLGSVGVGLLADSVGMGITAGADRDTLLSGSITYREAILLAEAADSKRSALLGLGVGGALLLGVSIPLIAVGEGLKK